MVAAGDAHRKCTFFEIAVHLGLPAIRLLDTLRDAARFFTAADRNPNVWLFLAIVKCCSHLTEAGPEFLVKLVGLTIDAVRSQKEPRGALVDSVLIVEFGSRISELADVELGVSECKTG